MISIAKRILLLGTFLIPSYVSAQTERPNIVFLFSDDLTTQAISAYNYGMDLYRVPL